ncbi:SIS domain-containing protein [uncultured Mesotoga sp.]|uniref:SIS domain-containing protein n=1 Tax=uncultured Mesotoga sp. TaxID=1184400 RepID=UPI00259752D5|nr:SIS domain-containing protein [uncultured Mesotoga sp.]
MVSEENKVYKEMIRKGLDQRGEIERVVREILSRTNLKNVFFVGCGGSLAVMTPCQYLFETYSTMPTYIYNAGEFVERKPIQFTKDSLLVVSSYSGKTPETVAAANLAKEIGAVSIGFTGIADSPLGKAVDYVFTNHANTGVTDSKIVVLYQILLNILKGTQSFDKYDDFMNAMNLLPEELVNVKVAAVDAAEKFAKENKNEKYFMVLGAGACWGAAYSYAICILEEMQWIIAQPVHAGEYFHGPFEIVTENTNLLILKGEDASRPVVQRAEDFSRKYSKKVTVVDSKDYELKGIPENLRGFFSPLVLSAALDVFSQNIAKEREHPLSTRRYMGVVDY